MFDFSTAEIGQDNQYLEFPGEYLATISKTELVQPDDTSKNPYLSVTFTTKYGDITDKFFITAKALGRLKALFLGVWDKELDKTFSTVKEVADFFISALAKPKEVGIKVIGEKVGDKVYKKLAYSGFIFSDLTAFEEKPIRPGDPLYDSYVSVKAPVTAPASTTIIPPVVNTPSWSEVASVDDSSDLPF